MKICITATGKDLESELDPRFGRAQFFLVYDLDKGSFQVIDNESIEASGGAGTAASQKMSESGAEVVISGNFGPNASDALTAFDIEMYTSSVKKVKDVIDDFKNENLKKVSSATVEGHHS